MEDTFIIDDDQRAILETVARFVKEEITPRAAALDANPDPQQCFSWDIVEKAHEVGIRTMTLAEKWGGLG
ncbi:MAG: acyl-CoA dehydrogenase family protein, partial [Burkholderiales bacterium]|nr:acyl-CoA dehydrogenase family protein [Burkholderiales bacterium]